MDAEEPELAQSDAQAKGGTDCHGKNEDKPLKESRHTHHRAGFMVEQAAHPLSAMIAQGGAACFFEPKSGEKQGFHPKSRNPLFFSSFGSEVTVGPQMDRVICRITRAIGESSWVIGVAVFCIRRTAA
jgi:hypothetical protein